MLAGAELMSDQGAQLAEECAKLVAERGHCKKDMVDENGAICLYGALNLATSGNVELFMIEHPGSLPVLMALKKRLNVCDDSDLFWWNDNPQTTGEDVILLFKHVAEDLRSIK